MKPSWKSLLFLSTLSMGSAQAEINFNGFASIVGGVTTSSTDALYGYDDTIDFSQGSMFALQASSDLGEGLSVTAQIISRGSDDWSPNFEWAYVSYDATDNLRILAGRQRAPFYMYSDFLDVSYAYPWITPPTGVYDLIFDTFDGLGAVYSTSFGEFDTTFQVVYGRNDDELDAFGEILDPNFNDLVGGSFTLNRDWLTLRGAYFQAEMNIPHSQINALGAGWQQAGFNDISSNVYVAEDTGTFVELGFQIDYDNLVIVGEYTELTLDNTPITDEESYYVMAGWRFDTILLHVTYGADENSKNDLTAGVPFGLDPGIDFLKANTQGLVNAQRTDQTYITLGLRWDFHDSAALKFEYTDFSDDLNNLNDAGLFRTAIVTVF
jgi:hypothetical protein